MYEHKIAYRHANGHAEGFVGRGFTKPKAKADAVDQIKRKLEILAGSNPDAPGFDRDRVIESPSTLTRSEIDIVQRDWRSGLRY